MQKKIKEENENKIKDIKVPYSPCRNQKKNYFFAKKRRKDGPSKPSNNSKQNARSS
jgi:hypothetical protein